MRCSACDQALWNVRGRLCPECGTPFSPSAQRFRPNSVEFCCAHCGQQYYGTDGDGLLQPRDFRCVTCGSACSMEVDMVLRPAPGTNEADVDLEALPWPPTGGAGWFGSAVRMLGMALGSPGRVGKAVGCGRETRPIVWLACLSIPLSMGGAVTAILFWTMGASIGGGTLRGSQLLEAGLTALGGATYPLPLLLAAVAVASALTWFVFRVGASELSYGRIFACWAFSCAPAIAMAVPCVGLYCGWLLAVVWAPVLAGLALARCTHASRWRVVVGVALPPGLVLLVLGGIIVLPLYITYLGVAAGGGPGAMPGAPQTAVVDDAETDGMDAPDANPAEKADADVSAAPAVTPPEPQPPSP